MRLGPVGFLGIGTYNRDGEASEAERPEEEAMEPKVPLPGPGRFQWNLGAWYGGQLGGTAWMLVGAIVLMPHAPEVAGVWLVCFAVPTPPQPRADGVGTASDRTRPCKACCWRAGSMA